MSTQKFDEIRDHALSLAHVGATPAEMGQLKQDMKALYQITSQLKVRNIPVILFKKMKAPVIVATDKDFEYLLNELVRMIESENKAGLRHFRENLRSLEIGFLAQQG